MDRHRVSSAPCYRSTIKEVDITTEDGSKSTSAMMASSGLLYLRPATAVGGIDGNDKHNNPEPGPVVLYLHSEGKQLHPTTIGTLSSSTSPSQHTVDSPSSTSWCSDDTHISNSNNNNNNDDNDDDDAIDTQCPKEAIVDDDDIDNRIIEGIPRVLVYETKVVPTSSSTSTSDRSSSSMGQHKNCHHHHRPHHHVVSNVLDGIEESMMNDSGRKFIPSAVTWIMMRMFGTVQGDGHRKDGRDNNHSKYYASANAKDLAKEIIHYDGIETLLSATKVMGVEQKEWDVAYDIWQIVQFVIGNESSIRSLLRDDDRMMILDTAIDLLDALNEQDGCYCCTKEESISSPSRLLGTLLRTLAFLIKYNLVYIQDIKRKRVMAKVLMAIKKRQGQWTKNGSLLGREIVYFMSTSCRHRMDVFTKSQYKESLPICIEILTAFPSRIGLRFLQTACAKVDDDAFVESAGVGTVFDFGTLKAVDEVHFLSGTRCPTNKFPLSLSELGP